VINLKDKNVIKNHMRLDFVTTNILIKRGETEFVEKSATAFFATLLINLFKCKGDSRGEWKKDEKEVFFNLRQFQGNVNSHAEDTTKDVQSKCLNVFAKLFFYPNIKARF